MFLGFLDEFGEILNGKDNVFDGGATGEVRDREVETLEDGASDGEASDLLEGFVDEVAGVEVGGDEDVGAASDGGVGGFFGANAGVDGGVELELAVDEDLFSFREGGVFGFYDGFDGAQLFERVIGAATTESGERKKGDARLVGHDFAIRSGGLADDFGELVGGRIFTGSHVGEEVGFIFGGFAGGAEQGISRDGASHNGETGENGFFKAFAEWGSHAKMSADGKNNVARRIVDAGDEGVGLARFDYGAGGFEVVGGEGGEV